MIGSARSFDGAAFVSNSKAPVMVVTFNYRVSILSPDVELQLKTK